MPSFMKVYEECINLGLVPIVLGLSSRLTGSYQDDRYILAKRYELKPDPKLTNGYEIPDETKVFYYILDTSVPKIYVCSNKDEFNEKRKALKASATLKLRDVASYNKSYVLNC